MSIICGTGPKHDLAADRGPEHLRGAQVVFGAGQGIAIDADEGGELARFNRAFLVFFKVEFGVVNGVRAQGLSMFYVFIYI